MDQMMFYELKHTDVLRTPDKEPESDYLPHSSGILCLHKISCYPACGSMHTWSRSLSNNNNPCTKLTAKHTHSKSTHIHIHLLSRHFKKIYQKKSTERSTYYLLHTLLSVRHFPRKEKNSITYFLPFLFTKSIFTGNTGSLFTLVENKYLTKTKTKNAIQNQQPPPGIKIQPLCLKSIRASKMYFYRHKKHWHGLAGKGSCQDLGDRAGHRSHKICH